MNNYSFVRFVVPLFLLLFGITSRDLSAQTAFELKTIPPNYSRYSRFEECVSAMERIRERSLEQNSVWKDTLRFKYLLLVPDPIPMDAVETGKACIGKVDVDTVSTQWVEKWGKGLLMAGLDEQARKLYDRYMSSIQDVSQYPFYENMVETYAFASPTRVDDVARLVEYAEPKIHKDSNFLRLRLAFLLFRSQLLANQLESARLSVEKCVEIAELITEDQRNGQYNDIALVLFTHLKLLNSQDGFDSLLKSTDAYRNHLVDIYAKVFRSPLSPLIGSQVDSVAGKWRFARGISDSAGDTRNSTGINELPSSVKRPSHGKINLFVFLHPSCHTETAARGKGALGDEEAATVRTMYDIDCIPAVALVQRAKSDFPNIEVTVLTRTVGYFANVLYSKTKDEADTLAHYYLIHHGIPGAVFVEETGFFLLEEPDSRRVDHITYNQYLVLNPIGRPEHVQAKVVLTDEDGRIVYFGGVGIQELEMTEVVLKALSKRISRSTP